MTTQRGAKSLWVVGAFIGAVAVSAGMRLAYTEKARSDMIDYEREVKEAINNPSLRAEWARKLEAIDARREQRVGKIEDCTNLSEEKRKSYEQLNNYGEGTPLYLPSRITYSAEHLCLAQRAVFEAEEIERADEEKESLGFYDAWAVKQAGFVGKHPWNLYPRELVERLQKGERGLLLGPFWNYIL
jgi:hypothetical protein